MVAASSPLCTIQHMPILHAWFPSLLLRFTTFRRPPLYTPHIPPQPLLSLPCRITRLLRLPFDRDVYDEVDTNGTDERGAPSATAMDGSERGEKEDEGAMEPGEMVNNYAGDGTVTSAT